MEPLGKMNAIFPVVNEQINKRNHKVCPCALPRGATCCLRAATAPRLRLRAQQAEQAHRKAKRRSHKAPTGTPAVRPRCRVVDQLRCSAQAQAEHDEAKEVFDLLNEQLISELPQLLDLRIPYFDPSFEAMIRMQCKFAEEGYEKLGGVQRFDMPFSPATLRIIDARFPDTLRIMFGTTTLVDSWMPRCVVCFGSSWHRDLCSAQVESVLQEMRELTICGAS